MLAILNNWYNFDGNLSTLKYISHLESWLFLELKVLHLFYKCLKEERKENTASAWDEY